MSCIFPRGGRHIKHPMSGRRSTLVAAAVVVVALIALGVGMLVGRGSPAVESPTTPSLTTTLDIPGLETQLSDLLSAQLDSEIAVTVTCPADVVATAGESFTCTGVESVHGTTLVIDVTETDDAGHVTWEVVAAR